MTVRLPDTSVWGRSPIDPGSSFAAIDFANEKFDFLRADGAWNVGKAETQTTFSADRKYEDLPDRYEQALRARRDDIAATISNPRARENFTLKTEAEIARSNQTAQEHARKLEAEASLRWLDEQQEKLIAATSSKSDPAEDFAVIPDITNAPDHMTWGGYTKRERLPAIVFWKRVNGVIMLVQQVITKEGILSPHTMWKFKTHKRLEEALREDPEP